MILLRNTLKRATQIKLSEQDARGICLNILSETKSLEIKVISFFTAALDGLFSSLILT